MSVYLNLFQSQFAQRKENEQANNPMVIDLNVLNRAYCAGTQQDAVQWIFVEGSGRNCKKKIQNPTVSWMLLVGLHEPCCIVFHSQFFFFPHTS